MGQQKPQENKSEARRRMEAGIEASKTPVPTAPEVDQTTPPERAKDGLCCESNLADFSIFELSRRNRRRVLRYEDSERGALWKVEPGVSAGLPGELAIDIVAAWSRIAAFQPLVLGGGKRLYWRSLRHLLRLMAKPEGGSQFKTLRQELDALGHLTIESVNTFYDNKSRKHRHKVIWQPFKLGYEENENLPDDLPEEICFVDFDENFLGQLQGNGYVILTATPETFSTLPPLEKLLLAFLTKRLCFTSGFIPPISLEDIAKRFHLTDSNPRRLRIKIENAITHLQAVKALPFLNKHRIADSYGNGKLYLQLWRVNPEKTIGATPLTQNQEEQLQTILDLTGDTARKYAPGWIRTLSAEGESRIMRMIGYYKERAEEMRRKGQRIDNPGGLMRSILKNDIK